MDPGLGLTMIVICQFSHELSLVINNVNPFPLELVASAVQQCLARLRRARSVDNPATMTTD